MSDINHNRMIPLHIADQAVAACEAEIQRLREENARLNAEVERLRKAGDEMLGDYIETGVIFPPSQDAWLAAKREQGCIVDSNKVAQYLPKQNAAKEGKQS